MPTDRHTATGTCEFGRARHSGNRRGLQENSTHRAKNFQRTACDGSRGKRASSAITCCARLWPVETNFWPRKTRSHKLVLVPEPKSGEGAAARRAFLVSGQKRTQLQLPRCSRGRHALTMSKSETIIFNCPRCEAEYRIVSIEAPRDISHGKIACLNCDALFPAGEGRVFFKYFLVGRPSRRPKNRK